MQKTTELALIGGLSALFFSVTFVTNRSLSLEGGHWYWTAALRYAWLLPLQITLLTAIGGLQALRTLWAEALAQPLHWLSVGLFGSVLFYGPLCFASTLVEGWALAASWQMTVVMSLVVLRVMGHKIPRTITLPAVAVAVGAAMAALPETQNFRSVSFSALLPVFLAAICYPLGNQLLKDRPLASAPCRFEQGGYLGTFSSLLLICLGSLPTWALAGAFINPPAMLANQVAGSLIVALSAGVIATGLFLNARHRATTGRQLALVDSTQGMEVVFAMILEFFLVGIALPGLIPLLGTALVLAGIVMIAYGTPGRTPTDRSLREAS